MHIPDGYISPKTFIPSYLIFIPLLYYAIKKVKKILDEQTIPLISSLAALSFVIMMFNIPIPGGTSGHAIGAAVIAILFNPWIGFLSISVVLIIQALVFGDGGITTYAVNALNMGFVTSFTAYYIHSFFKNRINNKINYFISGWFSIVLASLFVAVILGIQPVIASDSLGNPLYFPFGLKISIPALVVTHALFFGVAEGIFTMITISYIQKVYKTKIIELTKVSEKNDIFIFLSWLAIIIALVPLGLFSESRAWGEWGLSFFKDKLGFVPNGILKLSEIYFAPVKDYSLKGLSSVESYYFSAFLGVLVILLIFLLYTGKNSRKNSSNVQKTIFGIYFIALLLVATSNNIYFIGVLLFGALLISGKLIFGLLKRTIIILFLVNFIVTIFYLYSIRTNDSYGYYSLLLFNLRSFSLLFFTLLIFHKINIFLVFSFSKTISFLMILSYSQILAFKKTFYDFSLY